jgi:hypothetical protein
MKCSNPIMEVRPIAVVFNFPHGWFFARSKTITVKPKVGAYHELYWDVETEGLPAWLKIIKMHHVGVGGGKFTIRARAKDLPVGEYDAKVVVKSNALNSPVPIHVHLSVEEQRS